MLNILKHHSEKVQLFSVFCFQEAPIIFCAALERTVFWSGLPVIMNPTKRVHLTSGGGRPSAMSVIMFQLNLKVQNIKKHFHKEENLPEPPVLQRHVDEGAEPPHGLGVEVVRLDQGGLVDSSSLVSREITAGLASLAPNKDLHLLRDKALLLPSKSRGQQHTVFFLVLINLKINNITSFRIQLILVGSVICLVLIMIFVNWNGNRFSLKSFI
jgi:hypothetical protein